ncbi:MAG: iron-sulfur cluster assembly scaffold protein, partial [Pseudomonadota bacterium]
ESPDVRVTKSSRVCGSELTLDLKIERGVVADFGLEAKACALGQASAGLVAERLIGEAASDLCSLRGKVHAMLKEAGAPPDGIWQDLEALQAIRDYPQRHASTMLIFEALHEGLTALGFCARDASICAPQE